MMTDDDRLMTDDHAQLLSFARNAPCSTARIASCIESGCPGCLCIPWGPAWLLGKVQFLHEASKNGEIAARKIDTKLNSADAKTKYVDNKTYWRHLCYTHNIPTKEIESRGIEIAADGGDLVLAMLAGKQRGLFDQTLGFQGEGQPVKVLPLKDRLSREELTSVLIALEHVSSEGIKPDDDTLRNLCRLVANTQRPEAGSLKGVWGAALWHLPGP